MPDTQHEDLVEKETDHEEELHEEDGAEKDEDAEGSEDENEEEGDEDTGGSDTTDAQAAAPVYKSDTDWEHHGPRLADLFHKFMNCFKVHSDEGYKIDVPHDQMKEVHEALEQVTN